MAISNNQAVIEADAVNTEKLAGRTSQIIYAMGLLQVFLLLFIFITVMRDIAGRKKAEKKLLKAKKKADIANKAKSAFLANMSHEIRPPLNGLLGFGQLIINPDLTMDEKERYLEILNLSGDRLLETMTNYMDMSLLVSGNQPVKPAAISPYELINSLYKSFRKQCEAKELKMNLVNNETDAIKLETDRKLLGKAISHIIQNSIKFTEKGSISIGYNQEKARIIFFVRDTGIGIEKEAERRIFNLFEQSDASDSRPYEGSGLGLSIAKGYIELLGGAISFESEINKGTTFNISLPLSN